MISDEENLLHLSDELYLGHGQHKETYIDPRDSTRCVKVLFHTPDPDIRRELDYRKALRRRGQEPKLLTKYYGTVETDKGRGYVFERVMDYNGKPCLTFMEYFRRVLNGEGEGWPAPVALLTRFRDMMAEECIIAARHCGLGNILVQRLSANPNDFTVRILDDLGSNANIPLQFYWDFLARRHAEKIWRRWMGLLREFFPEIVTEDFLKEYHLETLG